MNKATRCLLLFSVFLITFAFLLPHAAYASPGLTPPYYSKPTTHVITGGISVSNPGNAYDLDNGTYTRFDYDPATAGAFEVKTFNTTATTNPIAFVDFKLRYEADSGGAGEEYRIVYYVNTSGPVILEDWTGSAYALNTRVWSNQPEPYDGVWNWTDISNIRLIVETKTGSGGASNFDEYEAWVSVYAYRTATVFVDPASLANPSSPFTIKINISTVDNLYAWEFKLYYNKTILTISTVTVGPLLNDTVGTANTWGLIKDKTDNYNATHGRVWVAQTILGNRAGATANKGTLASLSFTVDGPSGTSGLNLSDTKLIGYDIWNGRLTYMTHNVAHGSVTIPVAVPEFPLGAALEIGLATVLIYVWWRSKKKSIKLKNVRAQITNHRMPSQLPN